MVLLENPALLPSLPFPSALTPPNVDGRVPPESLLMFGLGEFVLGGGDFDAEFLLKFAAMLLTFTPLMGRERDRRGPRTTAACPEECLDKPVGPAPRTWSSTGVAGLDVVRGDGLRMGDAPLDCKAELRRSPLIGLLGVAGVTDNAGECGFSSITGGGEAGGETNDGGCMPGASSSSEGGSLNVGMGGTSSSSGGGSLNDGRGGVESS